MGIAGDARKVYKDYDISVKALEDLSGLANQKFGGVPKQWSMASLTEKLICKQVYILPCHPICLIVTFNSVLENLDALNWGVSLALRSLFTFSNCISLKQVYILPANVAPFEGHFLKAGLCSILFEFSNCINLVILVACR